jgi:hypothetical protein
MRSESVWVLALTMLRWCSATTLVTSAKQAGPIDGHHLDGGHEHTGRPMVPLDFDEPLAGPAGQRGGVGAVGPMHRHPASPGDEADDLVARHRRAAPGEADHQVVEALDIDTDGRAPSRAGPVTAAGER